MEYRVSVPPVVPLEREIERERERESRRWLGVWCGACPASCPQRVAAVYTSLIAEQVETTECRCGRQMWAHRLPHNPYLVCFTATVILLSMIVRCSKPTIMSHLVHIGSDGASIAVTMAWTILVLIWRLLWLNPLLWPVLVAVHIALWAFAALFAALVRTRKVAISMYTTNDANLLSAICHSSRLLPRNRQAARSTAPTGYPTSLLIVHAVQHSGRRRSR